MAVKERKTDEAERQVLLFGFEDLRSILDIKEALEPFGAAQQGKKQEIVCKN